MCAILQKIFYAYELEVPTLLTVKSTRFFLYPMVGVHPKLCHEGTPCRATRVGVPPGELEDLYHTGTTPVFTPTDREVVVWKASAQREACTFGF